MFNLKPKDDMFFKLFLEGTKTANKAAKELRALMDELSDPSAKLDSLTKLEHEGDKVTHDLIAYTKKMFMTPLDREDIFSLTKSIDAITDNVESTAYRFFMYNVTKPTDEAIELLDKLVEASDELVIAIGELGNLGKSSIIHDKIVEINKIENEADQIYRKAVKKIFADPSNVLFIVTWKDLYKYIEDSIDCCESLANELQGVIMKYV